MLKITDPQTVAHNEKTLQEWQEILNHENNRILLGVASTHNGQWQVLGLPGLKKKDLAEVLREIIKGLES